MSNPGELYSVATSARGVLEWIRCSYVKDPRTGRRLARPNPPHLWETIPVPELRIVSDELWLKAKERQREVRARVGGQPGSDAALNATHRARFLLSGLLRCGCCGGGYMVIGKDRYGCATRRQKGACDNGRTITRQEIESRVLAGLKERLLAPDLVAAFMTALQGELTRERTRRLASAGQRAKTLAEIDRRIAGMLRAIEDGLYEPSMKDRMAALRTEREAHLAAGEPG
ncbi:recombinase zinc ribbon domain-containing protein [Alsobacter sp. SYSU BS001988]